MSNHKWNFLAITVLVVLILALVVPTSALAGGGQETIVTQTVQTGPLPAPTVSYSAFFDFPRTQSDVAHRAGGKPWFWQMRWVYYPPVPGPVWEYYGDPDLLGVPNGYVLEAGGWQYVVGQKWTGSATLRPIQPIVPYSVAQRFPSVKYNAAWMAGGKEDYWWLGWDEGPAWIYGGPKDLLGVPPGFTLETNEVLLSSGQTQASYAQLRPAGPPCNAP